MDTAASHSSPLCQLIDGMPPRWALLVLLCLALVIRGRYLVSHIELLLDDPDGYGAVASNIDHKNRFSLVRVDGRSSPPTATRPPLYPIMLLPAYIVGDLWGNDDGTAAGPLHVVLGMLTVWAVWRLGRLWKLPPGACLIAAGLVAVDPILLAYSAQLMTETPAAFLAAVTLIALTHFTRQSSLRWAIVAGVLFGCCILCRPAFLMWLLPVAVLFPWLAVGPHRLRRLGVLLAAAALTLAPWGWRNLRVFGRPVITTTHGGFTLLLANNPDFYHYLRTAPWGSVWDGKPIYRQWQSHEQASVQPTPYGRVYDEVANDRWAYREALENIRAEPGMFAYSCLVRVGRLWNVLPHQTTPDESTSRRGMRYAVAIFYTFEFALAALGAWFLRGKLSVHPWVWGTLLVLSITAVHAFYWTDMRMRAPLTGMVALAAAYGLTVLACGKPAPSAFEQAV
jgi:Dolichyl-phosphate-mannose-protein mannosyltransferase